MIRVQDFSYRYQGAGQPALRGVDLEVERGEFVLLTGPSGCGKSTLALALAGFLFSQFNGESSGEIKFAGHDLRETPIYEHADRVGLIQQNPENQFVALTVEDEIVFGLENRRWSRAKMEERLTWSLQAVGCDHLRRRKLSTLSGGEKQKIALAAVLAFQPQVIIFDEPTSSLDPPSTREIFELILRLQAESDLTLLVIEHKLDFLRRANPRQVVMESGRILTQDRSTLPGLKLDIHSPVNPSLPSSPLISLDNISVELEEKRILEEVSFQIRAGELISLLGPNGSGKSTLLLTILGLIEPESGAVAYPGLETGKGRTSDLAGQIGLVFQNPDHQLFASTVWEEAVFAPRRFGMAGSQFEDRARELLVRAGLEGRLEDHPYRLSFGQKRRLNLVSVLAYQPAVLLLDEIFIGQDRENAAFLLQLLVDFTAGGGSVIMVNHNPGYYSLVSTRLMFLDGGKLRVDAPLLEGMEEISRSGRTEYLPGGQL